MRGEHASISAEQASRFAKDVAGDFNPIHDPDSRRFCVPGDLIFAMVVAHYGISERMSFEFTGMLGDGATVTLPCEPGEEFSLTDRGGKRCIEVRRQGAITHDPALIERFVRQYVAFSGRNFPHILVPLLAEQNVMINPDRPLVIYQSMAFDLSRLDFSDPDLELSGTALEVSGKRGNVQLDFAITEQAEALGSGYKKLAVGGLIPYEQDVVDRLIGRFNSSVDAYRAQQTELETP